MPPQGAPERQQCFYEVLGVERTASDDELKKSLSEVGSCLASRLDKNMDRLDEATEIFKKIQNAYSVLSDPHERKWYDDHRESILRGGDGSNDGEKQAASKVNLWQYFSPNVFNGYNDSETGFYTVYRNLFEELWEEELSYGGTGESPSFGTSTTPFPEIQRFYNFWESFVTKRNFAWEDMWNPSEAPTRQHRRAMEKENKKAREAARKEFKSQINELLDFMKKRDKRVLNHRRKVQAEKEERERLRAQEQVERSRRLKEEREKWMEERMREMEEMEAAREWEEDPEYRLADDPHAFTRGKSAPDAEGNAESREADDSEGESELEEEPDVWDCEFCNKIFKSEKQLKNHENSKKHKEKVEEFRKLMEEEDELFEEEEEDYDGQEEEDEEDEEQLVVEASETEEEADEGPVEGENGAPGRDSEVSNASESQADKRSGGSEAEGGNEEEEDSDSDDELMRLMQRSHLDSAKPRMRRAREGTRTSDDAIDDSSSAPDDSAAGVTPAPDGATPEDGRTSSGREDPLAKRGKAKKGKKSKEKKKEQKEEQTELACNVCGESFETRNKLFKHIQQTGHALATGIADSSVAGVETSTTKKKSKKKGKGKR